MEKAKEILSSTYEGHVFGLPKIEGKLIATSLWLSELHFWSLSIFLVLIVPKIQSWLNILVASVFFERKRVFILCLVFLLVIVASIYSC